MARVTLLALVLVSACSAPAGSVSLEECGTECDELVATCPGKVSEASCMSSCERAADFVWAASGSSCSTFFMGDRDDVPCGVFLSLPCTGEDTPDAGSSARPDARTQTPAADAAVISSTPDAGSAFVRCPIEKSALKVVFPYASMSPPTVVELGGSCFRQQNTMISEGYNSASAVNTFADATGAVTITDVAGAGILFEITFLVDQNALTQAQLGDLAAKTGIAAEKISTSEGRLVSTFSGVITTVDYALPTGVTVTGLIPSSSQDKGFITFRAAAKDLASLQKVLSTLATGISVKVPVQRYITFVGAPHFDYRFRLTTSGTKVKVEGITIVP